MLIRVFAACALLGSAAQVEAQGTPRTPLQVGIEVRPDTVTVGQHFLAIVRIRAPRGATIRFPEGTETPESLDTAGPSERRDVTGADYIESTIVYRLAAWRTGVQKLGLDDAVVSLTTGDRQISLVDSVFVKSVLPADTTLRKPKDPRPAFVLRAINWIPWLVAAMAVLLGGIFWWVWRTYRGRQVAENLKAYPWAECEFKRIEGLRLLEQNEPERHAILMAEVLRGYLEREFPTIPSSATTRELAPVLRGISLIPLERTFRVFERADLLKFADQQVSTDEARSIGTESRTLVVEINARVQEAAANASGNASRVNAQREAA